MRVLRHTINPTTGRFDQVNQFGSVFIAVRMNYLALLSAILASFLIQDVAADGASSRGEQKGKLWAVLVAGSEGWDNYRHQADVCHAYQVKIFMEIY